MSMDGAGRKITYIDHPVGHLAHAEPGGLTQLLFLVLAGVRVIRVAMEPFLQIVCRWFWQFSSFPSRSLCHSGSGGGKWGDGIQRSRMPRRISEQVGLGVLRESPGIELLLGF